MGLIKHRGFGLNKLVVLVWFSIVRGSISSLVIVVFSCGSEHHPFWPMFGEFPLGVMILGESWGASTLDRLLWLKFAGFHLF